MPIDNSQTTETLEQILSELSIYFMDAEDENFIQRICKRLSRVYDRDTGRNLLQVNTDGTISPVFTETKPLFDEISRLRKENESLSLAKETLAKIISLQNDYTEDGDYQFSRKASELIRDYLSENN